MALFSKWFKKETKEAQKADLDGMFIPVIFANGEDDDLPGLIAAVRNERVLYGQKVYEPDESICVRNRTLVLSRGLYVIGQDVEPPILPPWYVVVRGHEGLRVTEIRDNHVICKF